jgi:hypothetical protein
MNDIAIDPTVLPDKPNEWGEFIDYYRDGVLFRSRWLPGAFGRRKTLRGVLRYRVFEDEWKKEEDGRYSRTIIKGEALREPVAS